RRAERSLVAPPPGQHPARVVRHVGRMDVEPVYGAAVRLRLRARHTGGSAVALVLCGAGDRNAGPARGLGQSLHALQPCPDRPVLRWRGLDHFDVAVERALAIASSRASTVIISVCMRSLRCRFNITIRLIITQT